MIGLGSPLQSYFFSDTFTGAMSLLLQTLIATVLLTSRPLCYEQQYNEETVQKSFLVGALLRTGGSLPRCKYS